MTTVVDSVDNWNIEMASLPSRPQEVGVLMADAEHFDVEYVINPHMEGNVGNVDHAEACRQWVALTEVYAQLGFEVHRLASRAGLPDLVFTANQSLPAQLPNGEWVALMSHMHRAERRGEVEVVAEWYRGRNCRLLEQDPDRPVPFEGMGDAHWVPGKRLVVGGYGFRSARPIYDRIARALQVDVVALELVDDRFYHLDTCLAPLDGDTALYVPSAFTDAGRALLARVFDRLIEVPMDEASGLLSCNGHCPDGQNFIVQRGSVKTAALVRAAGFEVIEVETGEFLKSGGSVFCMKLMIP